MWFKRDGTYFPAPDWACDFSLANQWKTFLWHWLVRGWSYDPHQANDSPALDFSKNLKGKRSSVSIRAAWLVQSCWWLPCHWLVRALLRMKPEQRKAKLRYRGWQLTDDTDWVPRSSHAWRQNYSCTSQLYQPIPLSFFLRQPKLGFPLL